jgi:acetyltransferase-like isoleucine patch superfamily enzyme
MIKIINWIFQKILRQNFQSKFSVHFTSQVNTSDNINFNGIKTKNSFAYSGNCYIQAINGIELGYNTIFAPGVKIISANHDFTNLNNHLKQRPIIIGDNCWIGCNAVLLPCVEIGDNCIIGAGSVVNKSFKENNCLIAGNPAKIMKRYK